MYTCITESEQYENQYENVTEASIEAYDGVITPSVTIDPDIRPESDTPIEIIEPELPEEILEILGEPPKEQKFGKNLQPDIALRFEHIATQGLNKDLRKEILEKNLIPENSKKTDAPILNAEIKAALTDALIKKDKAIEQKQKQIAIISEENEFIL